MTGAGEDAVAVPQLMEKARAAVDAAAEPQLAVKGFPDGESYMTA